MDTLREIEQRLQTAADLHSVVRTMKSLAAVNIRQYEDAVASLGDYFRSVELGLRAALLSRPVPSLPARSPPGGTVVLVLGSEQGMVGQFNEAVAEHAGDWTASRDNLRFWVAGVRAAGAVEDRLGPCEQVFDLPSSAQAIGSTVHALLLRFEGLRRERGETGLELFYNTPQPGSGYRQQRVHVLPPDPAWLQSLGGRTWPRPGLPMARLPWERILAFLVGEYLFVALFRAFAYSLAAENAARLAAMQRAEKNIEETRSELQHRYHTRRQSAITEELFDVVSGFEALGGADGGSRAGGT